MKSLTKYNLGIALLLPLIASPSFAQSQGAGNGGGAGELSEFTGRNGEHLQSWYQVKQDLIQGLLLNRHTELNLQAISAGEFRKRALHALQEIAVEFLPGKIVIDGVTRSCRNFSNSGGIVRIVCDPSTYVQEMQNFTSEEQYRLVAHEYLGAAGLEPNQYGISDYPFSSQISKSLKNVKVKRWGVLASEEASIDIDKLDLDAIFNETSQAKMETYLHKKYNIPARLLSSPQIIDVNVSDDTRTYGITVFRRLAEVTLSCNLKLTMKTSYPRAEQQKRDGELDKTSWNQQFAKLVLVDSQLTVRTSQTNKAIAVALMASLSDNGEHIDVLSRQYNWNSGFVKSLAAGIVDPEHYTSIDLSDSEKQELQIFTQVIQQRIQQRQQDGQQSRQQQQTQQQQPQQQQAQAPTPVVISDLVMIDSACEIKESKGGPRIDSLTPANSELIRFGVEHRMIKK